MWTAPEIAELVAELDQHRTYTSGECWLQREWCGSSGEYLDLFASTAPLRTTLLGHWPRSEGILPPVELLEQLNRRLCTRQQAHPDALGEPVDSARIAIGCQGPDWLLGVVA